ncbi:L-threonine 3-dehydrogenase [Fimbriimonadia bacterium ATM]|nr:MAG: L-threonine 3-dehydrogenase [Armatimonadota bacterium]MBC6970889.1 L-threonine 3-dehydrogenase [Armatimonadota bacterium]MCE7899713.1 L-threonine 3-dehydrogenase [Armatimonadetes bacterium ATM1]MDL1927798.1 L-threonine 3-dehydrogenase [Fimbriimonadia bacterium ATM]RIJ95298.1 MAG: L-threonine 3-dehydrogenase [Armatimonadota bacterium]
MKAIAKVRPERGADLIEIPEPSVRPGCVKLRVQFASVCGTDYHIYTWDPWAAGRIKPPRVIGHEFAGVVEEVGEAVGHLRPGDFVASESHIVCGKCRQCLAGQGHVCVNTVILGVDVDGGFAPYVVVPEANARKTDASVPPHIACIQDPLGNAVHTVNAGPVEGQDILITGMGPIGLFALGVCKAQGARSVAVTEVSPYRLELAKKMGAELLINPKEENAYEVLDKTYPLGVDGTLEMSGHPSALDLAVHATRPGGRISLLGLFSGSEAGLPLNDIIFKGLDVKGIVGRRLWETWDQMGALLSSGRLNLEPVVTHRFHYTDFAEAMELIGRGETGKVVFEVS